MTENIIRGEGFIAEKAKTPLEDAFPLFNHIKFLETVEINLKHFKGQFVENFKVDNIGLIKETPSSTFFHNLRLRVFSDIEELFKLLNSETNKYKFEINKVTENEYSLRISYRHKV